MKARSRRIIAIVSATVVMTMTAACGATGNDSNGGEGGTINIGYFPVVSPVPIMQQQKLLEEEGYEVRWVPIKSGLPGAASALAAGRLDMTWGNSNSGTTIFAESPDAAQFVGQSFVNENIVVVNDEITEIEQLAGQKVVVSGEKTASTLFYEIGLKKAGVEPDRDNYLVSGTGPGMIGVMASGGADVAATYVPYSAEMVRKKLGHVLFTADDALGRPAPGDGFFVRRDFAKENPKVVVDVLRAQFAATDYIRDNPDEAYQSMADFASVDEESVRYSFEHDMIGFPDTYVPDRQGIIEVSELAQQYGFAPEGVELPQFAEDFVNTSYAKKALRSE